MACLDEQHGMVDVDALLQHHGEIDLGHRAANTFERLAQSPPVVAGEHGAIERPAALGAGLAPVAQGLAAEHEHDEGESQSAEPARSRQNAVNRATRPVIGPFGPWV